MSKKPPSRNGRYLISRGRMRCIYCKCAFNWDDPQSEFYPTKEHKQPRSRGGRNGGSNIAYACYRCNNEKGCMTLSEYREFCKVTQGCNGRVARQLRWKKHLGLMQAVSVAESNDGMNSALFTSSLTHPPFNKGNE